MATIKVEVTYDPKKETLSQALASLLTEKPEHTEITAQMSLFDNHAPTETPTAQASTEVPQESPAESAPETPDTKPAEAKTISTHFCNVTSNGDASANGASSSNGVAFGFCV